MTVSELIERLRGMPDDSAEVLIDACGGCAHTIVRVRWDNHEPRIDHADCVVIGGDR